MPVTLGHRSRLRFAFVLALLLLSAASRVAAQMLERDAVSVPVKFMFRAYSTRDETDSDPDNDGLSWYQVPLHSLTNTWDSLGDNTCNERTYYGEQAVTCTLKPGKDYYLSSQQGNAVLEVRIEAPPGYRTYIGDNLSSWTEVDCGIVKVRVETDAITGAVGHASSLRPGRIVWSVGLGNLSNGLTAGSICLRNEELSSTVYTPAALIYDNASPEVERIFVNNALRQVYTTSCLVDIVPPETAGILGFRLCFYSRSSGSIGAKQNGVYQVTGTPLYEYLIENSDPLLQPTRIRITRKVKQAADSAPLTTWTEMQRLAESTPPYYYYKVFEWVTKPPGATVVASPAVKITTFSADRRSESTSISDGTSTNRWEYRGYVTFPWGNELTSIGGGGAGANGFSYTDGSITNREFDGSGPVAYEYYVDFERRGRIKSATRGFGGTGEEITTYDYHGYSDTYDSRGRNDFIPPKSMETKINGIVTRRSESTVVGVNPVTDSSRSYQNSANANMGIVEISQKDYYDASHFLTTITRVFDDRTDPEYRFFSGLPHSVDRPDGTRVLHFYYRGTFNTASRNFAPSGTGSDLLTLTLNGTGMPLTSLKVRSGWQRRNWFQGLVDWQG